MKRYTWISNKSQPGRQTEEGQWHTVSHPHLKVQHTSQDEGINPDRARHYWHPDWVLFRTGSTGSVQWWADSRMSAQLDGPFKTRPEAMAYVTHVEIIHG